MEWGTHPRHFSSQQPSGMERGGGGEQFGKYDEDKVPLFGNPRIKYGDILQFITVVLLAVIVIVLLLAVFVISSHRGVLSELGARLSTVENLARNVDDASRVLRHALGETSLDDPGDGGRGTIRNKDGHGGGGDHKGAKWKRWLEDRGPDEEAVITDNAATSLVRGIRSAVRIMEQIETAQVPIILSRTMEHGDRFLTSPETAHILRAVDSAVEHPQAKLVAEQTLDMMAHIQEAVVPLTDAIFAELRIQIQAMLASGDPALATQAFQKMVREWMEASHRIAAGMRDFFDWYRQGGPSDAAVLASELIRTLRELIESPAAESLVKVLEGIDWKQTGARMSDAAHNAAEILHTVNQADTVSATDRFIRASAALLEDPGTKRVLNLLPGVIANATILLNRPSAQHMIEKGSALMSRMDAVLGQAEQARTVESASTFLASLRLLLGAVVDDGLHLEVGRPGGGAGSGGGGDQTFLERTPATTTTTPSSSGSLTRGGMPHIIGVEPEKHHRRQAPSPPSSSPSTPTTPTPRARPRKPPRQ